MKKIRFAILPTVLALGCHRTPPTPDTSAETNTYAASSFTDRKGFATPNEAADALIRGTTDWDVPALLGILGPDGKDLVASQDAVQDRSRASMFAEKAREKRDLKIDPNNPARATLTVGTEDWPLPIPIVQAGGRWYFDSKEGRAEVLKRRVGSNELDAITVLRGFVEAQKEYASRPREASSVSQYAQRVISTPGKHDGLAWQNPDGTWAGPVGPAVAKALEQGYAANEPFHGYYFRILQGQGPSAPLGAIDYVINGAMIGGFGVVAWPAEYAVTGVETLLVSNEGVVFQKDLGPQTAEVASKLDRYDPDPSWTRTDDAL